MSKKEDWLEKECFSVLTNYISNKILSKFEKQTLSKRITAHLRKELLERLPKEISIHVLKKVEDYPLQEVLLEHSYKNGYNAYRVETIKAIKGE